MAVYIFENTDAAEAAGFLSTDTLVFSNTGVTALNVTVTPPSGLSNGLTLTANGQSLAFPASEITAASRLGGIQFDDRSSLVLGTTGDDAGVTSVAGTTGADVIYGLGGNDSLTGAAGADYVLGGTGADTVIGGDGNDHLYGNSITTQQGATDGADSLDGGNGNDYLQGNAGADTLNGGAANDRIFGGADADSVDGGDGIDTINGNVGADTLNGGLSNDIVRGGQGADVVSGDAGDDILYGDRDGDTIVGGTGFDAVLGGDGADVFRFDATSSSTANIGATGANANVTDRIIDYVDGTDQIDLSGSSFQVLLDTSGSTFGTVLAAQQFAQSLINSNAAAAGVVEVAALNVGGDAYLFAVQGAGPGIDTAIKVDGVAASNFGASDFV